MPTSPLFRFRMGNFDAQYWWHEANAISLYYAVSAKDYYYHIRRLAVLLIFSAVSLSNRMMFSFISRDDFIFRCKRRLFAYRFSPPWARYATLLMPHTRRCALGLFQVYFTTPQQSFAAFMPRCALFLVKNASLMEPQQFLIPRIFGQLPKRSIYYYWLSPAFPFADMSILITGASSSFRALAYSVIHSRGPPCHLYSLKMHTMSREFSHIGKWQCYFPLFPQYIHIPND